jgi:hypothetical protein
MPYYPQPVTVKDAGTPVGTQPSINFIEGSNITLTITNDAGNNEVDVEIAASGGGTPAGSDTEIQYNNAGAFGADSRFAFSSAIPALIVGAPGAQFSIFAADAIGAGAPDGADLSVGSGFAFDDGMGTPASGGSLDIYSGSGVNSGNGGPISFTGGSAVSGTGSAISFVAGAASSGIGGAVSVSAGGVGTGTPGNVIVTAGSASTEGPGGSVSISATDGIADTNPDQNGGTVTITIGAATGSGTPGNLIITNLPSSDPGIPGAVYQSSGVLMVSL